MILEKLIFIKFDITLIYTITSYEKDRNRMFLVYSGI